MRLNRVQINFINPYLLSGRRDRADGSMPQIYFRASPFKVVKFGTKVGYFNFQKAQNMSGGFKMGALKQRMFICHLERASTARRKSKVKSQKYYGMGFLEILNRATIPNQ